MLKSTNLKCLTNPLQNQPEHLRGSALIATIIITVILTAVVAAILTHSITNYKISVKEAMRQTALNVAESAAEDALWALNQNYTMWPSPWQYDGANPSSVYKIIDPANPIDLGKNTATYKIYIDDVTATNPKLNIEATVTRESAGAVTRQLEIDLIKEGPYGNGIIGLDSVSLGADSSIDDLDPNDDYAVTVASPGTINIPDQTLSSILSGGGTAATGINNQEPNLHESIRRNYCDDPKYPDPQYQNIVPPASGNNAIPLSGNTFTLSSDIYKLDALTIADDQQLNVNGAATLYVIGECNILGSINFNAGASLKLYVGGNLIISGFFDMVEVDAQDFQIFGTGSNQTITIKPDFAIEIDKLDDMDQYAFLNLPRKITSNTGGIGWGNNISGSLSLCDYTNSPYLKEYQKWDVDSTTDAYSDWEPKFRQPRTSGDPPPSNPTPALEIPSDIEDNKIPTSVGCSPGIPQGVVDESLCILKFNLYAPDAEITINSVVTKTTDSQPITYWAEVVESDRAKRFYYEVKNYSVTQSYGEIHGAIFAKNVNAEPALTFRFDERLYQVTCDGSNGGISYHLSRWFELIRESDKFDFSQLN